ncbi:MAG: FkbM family methyltransferase [Planctomycetota bacterium]
MLRAVVHRFRALLGRLGWRTRSLAEWERWHDPIVRRDVARVLPHLPEDGVFLDIGANVGLFAKHLHEARPRARGILFEPVRAYYERCVERFSGVAELRLVHAALGDEDRTATIYKAAHNPGANSLMEDIMFDRRPNSMVSEDTVIDAEEVTLRHASRWLEAEGIEHVDFVKSDTEGYDFAVLRGLVPWLERTGCRPVILVELLDESYHPRREEQRAALAELERLGYAPADLTALGGTVGDALLLPRVATPQD